MTKDQKKVFKRIVENGRIRVDVMDALLILISEVERDASAPLERLIGEYQHGLDDAIKAIRAGRDDWSSGEDIGKMINWILGVAEGRITDLSTRNGVTND